MTAPRKEVLADGVEIWLGDCRDVLPLVGRMDAVVTDPPYGIGFKYESHDDSEDQWFELMDVVVPMCREAASFVVMPVCSIWRLDWWYANHKPGWMIAWHKGSPGQRSSIGFSDWEPHLTWGRPKVPMHDHFSTQCGFDENGHPCPKPIEYAMWLVKRAAELRGSIADPFMGSGTTGVACVNLGRKFIGIECEPKYFDIARRRISEALAQPRFTFDEPVQVKQESLFEATL